MSAQKIQTFDISPKQREILQFKHTRKIQLRQQYLKEILNPAVQTMPIDDAIQRLAFLRSQHEFVVQTRFWPHVVVGIAYLGSMYLAARILTYFKDKQEHIYRTGQLSYRDREFKFA
ncbi:hypothetical protein E2986_04030 [Frieseomelitta varia]|uniref:NADH dehydrogenase [ubiquinone] 1 beta subcomplex subunit 4 n=1 Tax=Frieseomelitta varia TaxID=561572 RepID=A0A833SBK5_9HYME|nr:uncharacterized protein LOC122539170 [Frieseomelitta varia]KAF3428855.1 hypothetical protein E2986_04030 [Frieseomelitta varia]